MLSNILFIKDSRHMEICSVWKQKVSDPEDIAHLTGLSLSFVREEITKLKKLGILKDGGELDSDVDKYINTAVGAEIKRVKTGDDGE